MRSTRHPHQLVTVLLLALAMALAGWAHRPAPRAELLAFAGPGGTLPALCLAGADGSQTGDSHETCPACTLAKSAVLAAPASLGSRSVLPRPASWRPVAPAFAAANTPRAPPARGPPAGLSA
jgi:hypothetical protein